MKHCKNCDTTKDFSEYHSRGGKRSSEYQSWCKSCMKTARRKQHRETRTGWSDAAFEDAWSRQEGRCQICDIPMTRVGKSLSAVNADHCHASGNTRALLCRGCNNALGLFKDDPDILLSAVDYLRRHKP